MSCNMHLIDYTTDSEGYCNILKENVAIRKKRLSKQVSLFLKLDKNSESIVYEVIFPQTNQKRFQEGYDVIIWRANQREDLNSIMN